MHQMDCWEDLASVYVSGVCRKRGMDGRKEHLPYVDREWHDNINIQTTASRDRLRQPFYSVEGGIHIFLWNNDGFTNEATLWKTNIEDT